MKYIRKFFESYGNIEEREGLVDGHVSGWRWKPAKKDMVYKRSTSIETTDEEKKELNGYFINNSKVSDLCYIEDIGYGFIMEDNNCIVIDCFKYKDIISLWKYDVDFVTPCYILVSGQDAGGEYEYNSVATKYQKNILKPVFQTKMDAITFMYLFKKKYSSYSFYPGIKAKLKYIFTPDRIKKTSN